MTLLPCVLVVCAGALAAQAPSRPLDPDRFKPTTKPVIHDPSTVVKDHGTYWVFGTGRGITVLSSPDSVTWTRQPSVFTTIPERVHAAVPLNNGTDVWAPDIIRVGDLWYLYYAVSSWGSFVSAVALATNPTLDPKDPAFGWTDRGVVVRSDGVEDLNAIDPGVVRGPDGKMWLCYGSYHGTIDLVELDAKTGLRLRPGGTATIVAKESEAADIIFRDGFFYLFVNHGSCCQGKKSTYTIRVGRSRAVTGPYLDRYGDALTAAPGNLFLAAHDHRIGPGHFGRLVEDGVERFSLHYEADLENAGRPTLDVRPLLWTCDGWPVAGDHLPEGMYQIVSRKTENTLTEGAGGAVRVGRTTALATERWKVVPAGDGDFRILNDATGDALGSGGATAPATSARDQMWKMEQFPDGTYRIVNAAGGLALVAEGTGAVATETFGPDDRFRWIITTP